MRKRNKVMLVFGSVLLSSCAGLLSYLLVMKSQIGNQDMEAIDITSPDTVSVLDYDLGVINPGESKEMRIDITSRVDFPIYCTVRLKKTMESEAFSYLSVSSSFGSQSRRDSFENCLDGYLFEKRMEGRKDTLKVSYTLKDDIPERIAQERLAFGIEICAKNVIG